MLPRPISASAPCRHRSRSPKKTRQAERRRSRSREAQYHGGIATKLDVYQAENVLGQTEVDGAAADDSAEPRASTRWRCCSAWRRSRWNALLSGSSGIPVPPKTVAVGIPADLVRRRPDIRAAELAAMAQSAQIGIAEANLYPAFSLTGTFGTSATNIRPSKLKQVFEGVGITFAFGPTFHWNILNYGQITNQVRVEDATLQDASGRLPERRAAGAAAGREWSDELPARREQVDYPARERRCSECRARALRFLQYKLGTRDFTTVLTAEQNLYTAQNDLAMAEGNVSTGLASVYEALGGGWQIRADNEFVPAATAEEMRNRTNWGVLLPPPSTPPAAGAGVADASQCQRQAPIAGMVRAT